MAHLSEDKLYYARLACMELEGELTNAVISKKSDKEIADYARRHQIARVYLGRRLEEKLTEDLEIPG
jgi:K+-sensing histidine kinase KdpD